MLTQTIHESIESGKNPHKNWQLPGALSLPASYRGMKLTSHPHLVPWLRISGSIPPICHMPSWYEQWQFYFHFTVLYFTSTKKKMGITTGQHNQNQYIITVMAEFLHT